MRAGINLANHRAYFDIPSVEKKHFKGSSPFLTDKLIEEIKGAKEIFVSFFLYNNPSIQYELEKVADNGGKVIIYSLPLKGYDQYKKDIFCKNYTESFKSSKHDYGEYIYKRIENNIHDIQLRIFPHTYVWYKQYFSRRNQAYSFHNKSVLVEFEDGTTKCITSSSNFALGDPPHSENMLVIENCSNTTAIYKEYFQHLDNNSMTPSQYDDFSRKHYDFDYVVKPTDKKRDNSSCYFTAPFFKYNGQGSNHFVQEKIINFISKAFNKIYICAQHVSDINSFDKDSLSIISALADVIKSNPSIEIKILKQTRPENQAQGDRTEETEKFLMNFSENIQQRYWSPVIHDKFIIVDDEVLVTTANFTSTAYAWAENYPMKYELVNGKINQVRNTFSEVNSFHFITEPGVALLYEKHFNKLWQKSFQI